VGRLRVQRRLRGLQALGRRLASRAPSCDERLLGRRGRLRDLALQENGRGLSTAYRGGYEYATRGGATTAYPWGGTIGKNNANCIGCGTQWDGKQTAPVGPFAANGFGLYDMVGNLWMWTEDCDRYSYDGAPTDGSAWTSGDCHVRVLRGGSFFTYPFVLRSASLSRVTADARNNFVGFRIGRTLLAP